MATVFLLLGSNLGDSIAFLAKARVALEQEVGSILTASELYQTAAWGKTEQPDFLNQVLKLETTLNPQELLATVLYLEQQLGRERIEKWGARTIDIDILFYDQEIINEADLKIPHPNLHERAFTLVPLIEIEPQLTHPVLRLTVQELLNILGNQLSVKKINL